ncbi:MAG: hypothetical protein J6R63_02285 [Kiritimatiellae bacterium]|nr:hypothetical protein [Kiritimatiellia bacterium]
MKFFILPLFMAFAAIAPSGLWAWPATILVDANDTPIKDLRNSTSAPDLGYAGAILEQSTLISEWFYISNRVESAKLIRDAGAWVVRPWSANDLWQRGIAWAKTKDREAMRKVYPHGVLIDPHAYFSFWKENGMKAILCLESYGVYGDAEKGTRVNDIEITKKVICDYVQWIVDNDYKECVAGFELGNEPYFGNDPELYGQRWSAIVPAMKRIWPEMKIGMPLAEYRAGDPDIAAVRARATGLDWVQDSGEFSFSKLNQWSGRFIVAMSNQLHNISHVIYHFYGADAAYGCGPSGFSRIKSFAKVFPEVADKRVWITEFRERSDEDDRCHQTFASSLWKGHYLLSCLAHPNIDGISLHNLGTLAGGLAISTGSWLVQWDPSGRDYIDIDYAGVPRMEVGPAGPVFSIYTAALKKHPLIINHGNCEKQGKNEIVWSCVMYYGSTWGQVSALASNKPMPPAKGNVEWAATMSADKSSLSVLMVNSNARKIEMPIELKGVEFAGEGVVKSVTITEGHVHSHLIPGERPLWIVSENKLPRFEGARGTLPIGPNTVQSITIPLKGNSK